jgi:hypothetical protein
MSCNDLGCRPCSCKSLQVHMNRSLSLQVPRPEGRFVFEDLLIGATALHLGSEVGTLNHTACKRVRYSQSADRNRSLQTMTIRICLLHAGNPDKVTSFGSFYDRETGRTLEADSPACRGDS